jgi:hypothetical protein
MSPRAFSSEICHPSDDRSPADVVMGEIKDVMAPSGDSSIRHRRLAGGGWVGGGGEGGFRERGAWGLSPHLFARDERGAAAS